MTQGLGGALAQMIAVPMLLSFMFFDWYFAVPLMIYGVLLFIGNMNQGFCSAGMIFIIWPHSLITERFLDKYSKNRKSCEHGNRWKFNKDVGHWYLMYMVSNCECIKSIGGFEGYSKGETK